MSPDKLIVLTAGIILIAFIWWFFFGNKEERPSEKAFVSGLKPNNKDLEIVVDGGYKPAVIFLKKGVKAKLKIYRKDPSTCLSDIILPDFKISKYLPLNKTVNIEFTPDKEGEFAFHCGMNMFHGKIIVD